MKKLMFIVVGCLTCLTLLTPNGLTHGASSKIYFINTSVGESYDNVGINYHCDIDNSYVIYGTNSNLSSNSKVISKSEKWSVPQGTDPKTGFSERFVCTARLENLQPNTVYYYQVIAGSEKSDILKFTTSGNNNNFSFLFLTDPHAASGISSTRTNNLVAEIEKRSSFNMIMMTGDVVDRGGYSADWETYFKGYTNINKYMLATMPGNHEYYHDNGPGYISPEYYNKFFFNPQNGVNGRVNSSYYFKYNSALIIMLDVIKKGELIAEQQQWFKDVVANNPSRWIIVGSHAGLFSTGVYADDAKAMRSNWLDIFEECQVDLALSGHEHIYSRVEGYYSKSQTEDKRDSELGVTYLVGPAAGMKTYTASTREGFDEVLYSNYSGNLIRFSGSKMIITLYNDKGEEVTKYEQYARRPDEIFPMSDQEILNSITYEYDKENTQLIVSWSPSIWGIVKKIACTGDSTWESLITLPNERLNKKYIYAIYDTYNYNFNLKIEKYDGTYLNKEIILKAIEEEKPELEKCPKCGKEYEKGTEHICDIKPVDKKGCKKKNVPVLFISALGASLYLFIKKRR